MPTPAKTFHLGGDLEVNRLGFGSMRLVGEGVWGPPADLDNAKQVLRRAVELGVNFIDTADSYGPAMSEALIGETLGHFNNVAIATKAGLTRQGPNKWAPVGRPEYLEQQIHLSLRYLRKDTLDLWQLHRIDPKTPVEESLRNVARLQRQGKVRNIGLSEVKLPELEQAMKVCKIASVQNQYNITSRAHDDVLDFCTANNIAFIPWFPVAAGKLAQPGGKLDAAAKQHGVTVAQLCIAWLLHRSPVMLPIPGTSSLAHLEENMHAAEISLTDAEWAAIEATVAAA